MPSLKANELRGLSITELDQKKNALEKELLELRQKRMVGQLDKPHQFRKAKREIAKINTVKREKKNG